MSEKCLYRYCPKLTRTFGSRNIARKRSSRFGTGSIINNSQKNVNTVVSEMKRGSKQAVLERISG
ncbi:MAG: hypothetical protein LBH85_02130, partial [Treponema sp.]|nr:hypothetical protein [Treponema sp.]